MTERLTFRFVGWLDGKRDPSLIASAALRPHDGECLSVKRQRDGVELTVLVPRGAISREFAASESLERAAATVGCRLESVMREAGPDA